MPKEKRRPILQYDRKKIYDALQAIKDENVSIREASRKYGVPRGTLQDRLHGRVPENCKMGRDSALSKAEEEALVQWLTDLAKCGFARKRDDLLNTVQNIMKAEKRPNKFTNDRPGRKWYDLFIKRHPILNERIPEGISKGRAVVTEEYIRKWFYDLKKFLIEINAIDLLQDPRRILNGDETSFSVCPKTGKVIAPKGWKNVYEVQAGSEKETITVLLVFTAAGDTLQPMVVFPYVRPPSHIIASVPDGWFLGRSETGWMRSEIFFEYIANGVNAWLEQNSIPKPVLLFVDGHKSHLTLDLNKFCYDNQIILYSLPPNTTHLMQPADVSVFRPLKVEWKKTVRQWQGNLDNYNSVLTKATFCPLLEQTLKKDMKETIKNGFRRCGLFPFNADAVDYTKCIQNTLELAEKNTIINNELNTLSAVTMSFTREEIVTAQRLIKSIKNCLENENLDGDRIVHIIETSFNPAENQELTPGNYIINARGVLEPNDDPQPIIPGDEENVGFLKGNSDPPVITLGETNNDILDQAYPDPSNRKLCIAVMGENPSSQALVSGSESNGYKDRPGCNSCVCSIENSSLLPMTESALEDLDLTNNFNFSLLPSPATPTSINNRSGNSTPTLLTVTPPSAGIKKNRNELNPSFRNHLFSPKSLQFGKRRVEEKNKMPAAISSEAWKNYMLEKEQIKQEQLQKKTQRQEALKEKKAEQAKKKEDRAKIKEETGLKKEQAQRKKPMANKQNHKSENKENKKTNKVTSTQSQILCTGCDDELISDVEDDDLKNLGCDMCPRWFHLKCTLKRGMPYAEVATKEFVCHICVLTN